MKQKLKWVIASIVFFGCLVLCGNESHAQQQPRTTIQLPTFRFFGVNTTVWVPDRGQALLGSIKRSSQGSVSRGVPLLNNVPYVGRAFGNRAIGSSSSAATTSIGVQIYDLREMDRALLEEARRDRVQKLGGEAGVKRLIEKQTTLKKADFITRNLGGSKRR